MSAPRDEGPNKRELSTEHICLVRPLIVFTVFPLNIRTLSRRIPATIVVTTFYFGLLIYPLIRLIDWLVPDWQPGTVTLLVLLVLPPAVRILSSRFQGAFARQFAAISMTWMGLCFQLFPIVIVLEIFRLLVPVTDTTVGLICLVAILILGGWGLINAQLLNVRHVPLATDGSVAGKSLVQITDVHIGSRRPTFLRRIVKRINELQADAVMITGDLVDDDVSEQDLRSLAELNTTAYFILGNHERYANTEQIIQQFRALNGIVLRNETVDADPFQFIGLDDAEARDTVKKGLSNLSKLDNRYRILLYHRPEGAEEAADWGINVMVSGHTHRGQIFPFNHLVKRIHPRLHGSFAVGDLHLYVSPGTGTWGPILRTKALCELTQFQFSRDPITPQSPKST